MQITHSTRILLPIPTFILVARDVGDITISVSVSRTPSNVSNYGSSKDVMGIFLLKNKNKLLPLDKYFISSLAVVGHLVNSANLEGGYIGVKMGTNVEGYAEEENLFCNSSTYFAKAISIAR